MRKYVFVLLACLLLSAAMVVRDQQRRAAVVQQPYSFSIAEGEVVTIGSQCQWGAYHPDPWPVQKYYEVQDWIYRIADRVYRPGS